MGSRVIPAILITLLVIVQAQLWFGRGSVLNVGRNLGELQALELKNLQAKRGNERLAVEIQDLKEGLDLVEEKARMDLGMVKPNEIFVQILP